MRLRHVLQLTVAAAALSAGIPGMNVQAQQQQQAPPRGTATAPGVKPTQPGAGVPVQGRPAPGAKEDQVAPAASQAQQAPSAAPGGQPSFAPTPNAPAAQAGPVPSKETHETTPGGQYQPSLDVLQQAPLPAARRGAGRPGPDPGRVRRGEPDLLRALRRLPRRAAQGRDRQAADPRPHPRARLRLSAGLHHLRLARRHAELGHLGRV